MGLLAGADALDAAFGCGSDTGEVVAGEVGQLAGLDVRPQQLEGVEGAWAGSRSSVSQSCSAAQARSPDSNGRTVHPIPTPPPPHPAGECLPSAGGSSPPASVRRVQ